MTINLTELRDEPLGKHPIQAAYCYPNFCGYISGIDVEQDVVAADHESTSTFDVDSLNDEALDARPAVHLCGCACTNCFSPTTVSDEALDYSPTVNAFGCARPCDGIGDEVLDTPRQTEQAAPSVFTCYGHSFCGR